MKKAFLISSIFYLAACGGDDSSSFTPMTMQLQTSENICLERTVYNQADYDESVADEWQRGQCSMDDAIASCKRLDQQTNERDGVYYYFDPSGVFNNSVAQANCEEQFDGTFTTIASGKAEALCFDCGGVVGKRLGLYDSNVTSVVQQEDSKLVAFGQYGDNPGVYFVARHLQDGRIDTSFGDAGVRLIESSGWNAQTVALKIQDDGKLLLLGNAGGSSWETQLIRLNSDGSTDQSFGESGWLKWENSNSFDGGTDILLNDDGKVVMAVNGDFFSPSPTNSYGNLLRFNSDGSLDRTFGMFGFGSGIAVLFGYEQGFDISIDDIALQDDGKIIAVGHQLVENEDGESSYQQLLVARFLESGEFDQTFGTKGIFALSPQTAYANSVAALSDGSVVLAGRMGNSAVVLKLTNSGALDDTFNQDGIFEYPSVNSSNEVFQVLEQSDGKLLLVTHNAGIVELVRLTESGILDSSFVGLGSSEGVVSTAVANVSAENFELKGRLIQQLDGRLVLGGEGPDGEYVMARYDLDGVLDKSDFAMVDDQE